MALGRLRAGPLARRPWFGAPPRSLPYRAMDADKLGRLIRERPRGAALAIFALALAVYSLNGRPLAEIDCLAAPYAAWSVARHGDFEVGRYRYLDDFEKTLIALPDGRLISRYPPGSALTALPVVAPFAWANDEPLRPSRMRRLGKLAAGIASAGAVVAFAFACTALAPGAVLPATVLFALGTSLFSTASQALWTHGAALLWLTLGIALLLPIARASSTEPSPRERESSGRPNDAASVARGTPSREERASSLARSLAAGLSLGLAVVARPTSVLFAAALPGALFLLDRHRRREAIVIGAGAAVPILGLMLYNQLHFGAPVAGGYGEHASRFVTPFFEGLAGVTISPSRGLFIYSPALVVALLGAFALPRAIAGQRERALVIGLGLGALATIALYAKWKWWWGGASYGPRLLCEALPALALLFAIGARDRARWPVGPRRALAALIAVSCLVHFVGVFGHGNDWNDRHPDGREGFYSLRDSQIAAAARMTWIRLNDPATWRPPQ